MELIDTHTHVYLPDFEGDYQSVKDRADKAGVTRCLMPNIDSNTVALLKNAHARFPTNYLPMMGVHPCSIKADFERELNIAEKELQQGNYIAIGETGLDFYWDTTYIKEQEDSLIRHIGWAKEWQLPIVLHCRDSFDRTIEIIETYNDEKLKGVFHCFSGSVKDAQRIKALGGFYMGIGGVLTFKNGGLDREMAQIGLDNVVLETDAPYLTPTPYRGKRNEPSYTLLIAEKLAGILNISLEEVASKTSLNAQALFDLRKF